MIHLKFFWLVKGILWTLQLVIDVLSATPGNVFVKRIRAMFSEIWHNFFPDSWRKVRELYSWKRQHHRIPFIKANHCEPTQFWETRILQNSVLRSNVGQLLSGSVFLIHLFWRPLLLWWPSRLSIPRRTGNTSWFSAVSNSFANCKPRLD